MQNVLIGNATLTSEYCGTGTQGSLKTDGFALLDGRNSGATHRKSDFVYIHLVQCRGD